MIQQNRVPSPRWDNVWPTCDQRLVNVNVWPTSNQRLTNINVWPTSDERLTNVWPTSMSDQRLTNVWPTSDQRSRLTYIWPTSTSVQRPIKSLIKVWPTSDQRLTNVWPTPTSDQHQRLTKVCPTSDQRQRLTNIKVWPKSAQRLFFNWGPTTVTCPWHDDVVTVGYLGWHTPIRMWMTLHVCSSCHWLLRMPGTLLLRRDSDTVTVLCDIDLPSKHVGAPGLHCLCLQLILNLPGFN